MELEKMSGAELTTLIRDANAALVKVREREREQALQEMRAVAERYGLDPSEFVKEPAKPRAGKSVRVSTTTEEPIRFQHPEDDRLTWTGRGRMPSWLKERRDEGEDIEDYRIAP